MLRSLASAAAVALGMNAKGLDEVLLRTIEAIVVAVLLAAAAVVFLVPL